MSHLTFPGANKSPSFRPAPSSGPAFKPRTGGARRWYIPLIATIGLGMFLSLPSLAASPGFVAYDYYLTAVSRREQQLREEEIRWARNQQLMDAYGDKESLRDVQQALDAYEVR
ncbi:hypothetical protein N7510_005467 [Penicillium lagena]|uniref:uncharacterized protein n=1 Tax=Penicillium lagena TaxID=94218 RepID=UPI002541E0EB|nr:uncharacterized protein N7510_005467 [Penicillium lagena]KAJ5612273.1 hypothetical protein N7510_005467 [Penicillium lagena]